MKKLFCSLFLLMGALAFSAAEGIAEEAAGENAKADASYAFGMLFASDLKNSGVEFNYGSVLKGFRDMMENNETRFNMDEAVGKAQAVFRAAMEEQARLNSEKASLFFDENGKKSGVITTASGLQYEVLAEGTGREPLSSDFVRVNYQGALLDGTIFDSSIARGEPEEFPLEGVIQGWSEGLLLMREGGKSRLYIPPALGYGARGMGSIPPNSVLVFEVELLEIVDAPEAGPGAEEIPYGE